MDTPIAKGLYSSEGKFVRGAIFSSFFWSLTTRHHLCFCLFAFLDQSHNPTFVHGRFQSFPHNWEHFGFALLPHRTIASPRLADHSASTVHQIQGAKTHQNIHLSYWLNSSESAGCLKRHTYRPTGFRRSRSAASGCVPARAERSTNSSRFGWRGRTAASSADRVDSWSILRLLSEGVRWNSCQK